MQKNRPKGKASGKMISSGPQCLQESADWHPSIGSLKQKPISRIYPNIKLNL